MNLSHYFFRKGILVYTLIALGCTATTQPLGGYKPQRGIISDLRQTFNQSPLQTWLGAGLCGATLLYWQRARVANLYNNFFGNNQDPELNDDEQPSFLDRCTDSVNTYALEPVTRTINKIGKTTRDTYDKFYEDHPGITKLGTAALSLSAAYLAPHVGAALASQLGVITKNYLSSPAFNSAAIGATMTLTPMIYNFMAGPAAYSPSINEGIAKVKESVKFYEYYDASKFVTKKQNRLPITKYQTTAPNNTTLSAKDEVTKSLAKLADTYIPCLTNDLINKVTEVKNGNLILVGASGTGKTHFMKAIAEAAHVNALYINAAGALKTKVYVGTESLAFDELARIIYEKVNSQELPKGSIVFLDEVDELVSKRAAGRKNVAQNKSFMELQDRLEKSGISLFCATNSTIDELTDTIKQRSNTVTTYILRTDDQVRQFCESAFEQAAKKDPEDVYLQDKDRSKRDATIAAKQTELNRHQALVKHAIEMITKNGSGLRQRDLYNICREVYLKYIDGKQVLQDVGVHQANFYIHSRLLYYIAQEFSTKSDSPADFTKLARHRQDLLELIITYRAHNTVQQNEEERRIFRECLDGFIRDAGDNNSGEIKRLKDAYASADDELYNLQERLQTLCTRGIAPRGTSTGLFSHAAITQLVNDPHRQRRAKMLNDDIQRQTTQRDTLLQDYDNVSALVQRCNQERQQLEQRMQPQQ